MRHTRAVLSLSPESNRGSWASSPWYLSRQGRGDAGALKVQSKSVCWQNEGGNIRGSNVPLCSNVKRKDSKHAWWGCNCEQPHISHIEEFQCPLENKSVCIRPVRSGDSYSIHSKCAWWSFHPQKNQSLFQKQWEGVSLVLSQTRLSSVVLRLTSPHCGVDVILLVSTIWKDHFVLCHSKCLSYTVMAYQVFQESLSAKKNWKFSLS